MGKKKRFRIKCIGNREGVRAFRVQMLLLFFWVTIKTFEDEDVSFAFKEAEKLLKVLGGNEIIVPRYE